MNIKDWVWLSPVLLSLLAGGGCASRLHLPQGSQPASQVHLYPAFRFSRRLPGNWRVEAVKTGQHSYVSQPNLIRRYAEIAGIANWNEFEFTAPDRLRLRAGKTQRLLYYQVSGNELILGQMGPHISHDDWEMNYASGTLFLRSLIDAQTYAMKKIMPGKK